MILILQWFFFIYYDCQGSIEKHDEDSVNFSNIMKTAIDVSKTNACCKAKIFFKICFFKLLNFGMKKRARKTKQQQQKKLRFQTAKQFFQHLFFFFKFLWRPLRTKMQPQLKKKTTQQKICHNFYKNDLLTRLQSAEEEENFYVAC